MNRPNSSLYGQAEVFNVELWETVEAELNELTVVMSSYLEEQETRIIELIGEAKAELIRLQSHLGATRLAIKRAGQKNPQE